MKTRKQHKKSRNGCLTCKSRHIKCDEQKPGCYNCERYATECIYPLQKRRIRTPDYLAPIAVSTPSLAESTTSHQGTLSEISNEDQEFVLHVSQLRLLHQFSTVTAKTLSAESRNEDVYSSYLVKVAFDYPFLLHGVLALAALHLSLLEPGRRPEYLLQAERHHRISLNRFRVEISTVDEFNYEAVFFFNPEHAFDSVLSNLILTQRVRPLVGEFYARLTQSELGRLRPEDTRGIDWDTAEPPVSTELVRLRQFADVAQKLYTEEITEAYTDAIRILLVVFHVAGQSLVPPSDALLKLWIHFVSPRFMELLSERQPGALFIFAHYAVLLKRASHYWFLGGVAEQILTIAEALLPTEWGAWRTNSEMQPWLIVLVVIIAAGATVCCGLAVSQLCSPEESASKIKSISQEQAIYMAEVHARNMDTLARESGRIHFQKRITDEWQGKGR
ncbi:hypothetical protein K458DRAFT_436002 [Lentithecium fluviatile CBS 122367]|uniref:Zn(2)-C6 fungal-type domain-containing protein n=1 Tax=Lentithecium fluviatile CBS 122367 TaxID=1168545 RepID=A0A6G1IJD1_9PLEO|nr:hypothetical protein K458DRAFT_436002 [Lentithecium fluviatile CBS 122367]